MLLIVNNWFSESDHTKNLERYQPIADLYASRTGATTIIKGFREVSLKSLRACDGLSGIILGGSPDDYGKYDMQEFAGEYEVIRDCELPILGICAGHQLIGFAHGVPVEKTKPKEKGYCEMKIQRRDAIFDGLPDNFVVHEGHEWEVMRLPKDYVLLASSGACELQVIRHRTKPVYGVQFHPEMFTPQYPHGEAIISNFLKMCVSASA
ncbi:MAG: gamma-glutamyl-gamma-aminobutyrate hydrolase family protein [Verrucomicrobia bacterium]|nr:gamma-glutamyl-gamma-aminobutyrate hydrolase family protein [Verrucomicrobiota bacterium]MBU4248118.1 gamma-glutamyl-gamma-aminobutyrate hydrolase family protein [Verrucomicrobiota bacterium]MBU4290646.1 gamma-glutamyl-gamma-aminobutyrate hydrolase family protein [Verrucomicrobiota bacterium]MBU4428092.1 gamma-glutamyl-gamma-aminobutyrate hydrolase family protein [Verrucomicrobiota bacterium]MCG2681564.1 gamma-glutamyl-gamma-aminobutyrate hydrolase family protein [Kiritimatiellia bacterium]